MISQRDESLAHQLNEIQKRLDEITPRINLYCKRADEKELIPDTSVNVLFDILYYYVTELARYEKNLKELKQKNDSTYSLENNDKLNKLEIQIQNLKNKLIEPYAAIKKLSKEIDEKNNFTEPREVDRLKPIEKGGPQFFSKQTAALAATTVATCALGYLLLKPGQ